MTRILCYDNLPSNWMFEFVPAREAVQKVLENKVGKVFRFDWRPL